MFEDPTWNTAVEVVLLFVTAFGVPIAIYFASPYLGLMVNFQAISERRWLEEARKKFEASNERKLARAQVGGMLVQEQRRIKAASKPTEHAEEPRRIKAGDIVAWYRQELGLQPGDPIRAADAAEAYFRSINHTPQNGDFARLDGAIRTFLSRERNTHQ